MPLRDYKCRVCNYEWEELRKNQTDPERCPSCKCDTVSRKLSSGAFSFKHGGFSTSYEKSGQIK